MLHFEILKMYGRAPAVTEEALLVLHPFGSFPVESESGPFHTEGQRRQKKEPGLSRLAGGSFHKQKDLLSEACLGRKQDKSSPPATSLKFRQGETGAGCAGVLNTATLPQGCVLAAASGRAKAKQNPHSKDGGGGVISWVRRMGRLMAASSRCPFPVDTRIISTRAVPLFYL